MKVDAPIKPPRTTRTKAATTQQLATAAPAPAPALRTLTPNDMLSIAVQRGATVEELDRLITLVERMRGIEAHQAFTRAMVQFKQNPPTIQKTRTASVNSTRADAKDKNYSYKYANLADVCNGIIVQLAGLGISHDHAFQQDGTAITVKCTLTHELGHTKSAQLTAHLDTSGGKNSLQGLGSATSYLERYTLLGVCGLALDDEQDDDGAAGITQDERAELRTEARQLRQRHSASDLAAGKQGKPGEQLLQEARDTADKGHSAFGLYWRNLPEKDRTQLLGDLNDLTERANAATAQEEPK